MINYTSHSIKVLDELIFWRSTKTKTK